MPWRISSKLQILFLSSIGVYRTVREFYSQNLNEIWEIKLTDNLSPYQNFISSVISGIILVREFTGHLYIASYFLILYPLIMGKMRSALLLWMFVSGLRSILLNLGVAIIGVVLCSSQEEFSFACFKFVAEEAIDLGCSIYMWTVVNDYYHSLKKASIRSHFQSPLNSPNTSSIVEDTSSSFLSEEWSLPLSLVEEFQKSTKENLLESATKTTTDSAKNLKNRSVDSLLAQAMVDWFIKKIVKFKPKEGADNSSPTNLPGMDSKNINILRQRIKKSIADIDESDIKDLLASQNSIDQPDNDELSKGLEFKEQSSKKNIQHVEGKDISANESSDFQGIENDKEDLDKVPDLISDIQRSKTNVMDCFVSNKTTGKFPFETKVIDEKKFIDEKITLQPLNAVTLVKHLFDDSFESMLEKTVKCRRLESNSIVLTEKSNQSETVINEFDGGTNKYDYNSSLENKSAFDFNEKALDCSIVIVKSLLENVIDSATDNKQSILKKEITDYTADEINRNLNKSQNGSDLSEAYDVSQPPLKDINVEINPKVKTGLRKKISFQDEEFLISSDRLGNEIPTFKMGFSSGFRNSFDDFPERVRSVLKSVNMDRISRKADKLWKTKKPYNKENEFDSWLNYKKKERKTSNESEMNIKALRYHFRRSNPSKVPIKRSKDTILSQKSLKSIIEGIKLSDVKKIKSSDLPGSSGVQYTHNTHLKKTLLCNYKPLNNLKDSSAQTITTRTLLTKIKEAEEENDCL